MGGHDQLEQQQQQTHADGDHAADAKVAFEQANKSLDFVIAFSASGKGKQTELPMHVQQAAGRWGDNIKTLMPDIAKHAKGEVVLECAGVLGMSIPAQIELALKAKTPITAASLRSELGRMSQDQIASIAEKAGLVAELRKVLTGPIIKEAPQAAYLERSIYLKRDLLQWWLETTNVTAVALELSHWTDSDLTENLDALAPSTPKAWEWLDHLDIAPHSNVGYSLKKHLETTKNATAKTKLTALVAKFKPEEERKADIPQAKADLATQLSGTDDKALLDAAARTQGHDNTGSKDVRTRLKGESADVVAQYLATMQDNTTLTEKIEILDQAKGAREEHLLSLIRSRQNNEIVGALQDDRTRKLVRAMMGKATHIRDLLSVAGIEDVHATIVKDDALRQWWYEDKDPRTLLWLATGSPAGAKDGCRLVKSEKGNDWVKHLPRTVEEILLRRFVVNTTDTKLATWVKTNLLHDAEHKVSEDDDDIVEPSKVIYGQNTKLRLDVATAPSHLNPDPEQRAKPDVVLARLADLSESERAALLKSKKDLQTLFEDLEGFEMRAVFLLQPTMPQLLAMPIKNAPELVNYSAGRKQSEQVAAGGQAVDARRVFGEKVTPFVALPLLRAPNNLAEALEDNEQLLDWIIETTEPNQALEILARDPARKVAAGLMESRSSVYAGLPAFEKLRNRGRESFKTISKHIKDGESKAEAADYVEGNEQRDKSDKEVDTRASTFQQASNKKLWHAIEALFDAVAPRADLISVVQASEPSEQVELLGGSHDAIVKHLQQRTQLGPQHMFIDLGISQLLNLSSSAEWLLTQDDSYTVLNWIGAHNAKALGQALSRKPDQAKTFIQKLPKGQNLTVDEQHALDQTSRHVTDGNTLRLLFSARFHTGIEKSYDVSETRKLWAVLERLPPAQVNQHVIRGFTEKSLDGPIGQWDSGTKTIDLEKDPDKLKGNDHHYQRGITLSADEVKAYYGLDDAALKKASDPKGGWLIHEGGRYRVKPSDPKQFTTTVLHEVGHSIDDLLETSTNLVYDLAGWKRYGWDQFEQFANEMGALENISAADRPKIVEAWQQALRSKTAVNKIVGADHPALQDKTSPLAKWVKEDNPFPHDDPKLKPANGRVFFKTKDNLASVKKQTYDNAPTEYSMTAPGEWFAECYVEYYCRYDGTSDTQTAKGGNLPNWIKKWFDEHIDKIRLNPQRVRGDKADNTQPPTG